MVTFQELSDLRLGKLKAAVTDWEQMVGRLVKLADGGDGGTSAASLEKKAKAADWKGHNAVVTKSFVTTTASEFQDAVTAARSIHTVLSGAHTRFTKHKQDLAEAVDRAAKKNIYVNAKGGVRASVPPPHVAGDAKIEEPTQAQLDAVAKEIGDILDAAAETDRTTATALRFHATEKYDFRSEGFKSFDAAERSIKDSNEAVGLGRKDPTELSNKDLDRFNRLLQRNADDPVFAERVATGLGPDRTLRFYADAADLDRWQNNEANGLKGREERTELLAVMEKQLGTTVATATHSGSDAMAAFKERVIALGGQDVSGLSSPSTRSRVYGFQAMSGLMRHGVYEREFLGDYGDALVKYEKENTGDVRDPGPGGKTRENVLPWDKSPSYARIDQLHHGDDQDAGRDPMTGFMKALSRNPEAATDFFHSTEPNDNSEWVLKERPKFNDIPSDTLGYGKTADDYTGPSAATQAVSKALVAGATGMDPGDENAVFVPHTDRHEEVFQTALKHLSALGDEFPPEMRNDMAVVLGNHGSAVHETMSDVDNKTPLDREHLFQVSKQISRDQDAHGVLNESMHYALLNDIHSEEKHPENSLDRVGRTVGYLERVRFMAVGDRAGDELAEVGWDKNWRYHGWGSLANFVPGVGDLLQRGADIEATAWLEDEQERIEEEENRSNRAAHEKRNQQLVRLADEWYRVNEGWAVNETGYSQDHGVYSSVQNAANNGNDRAEGLKGAGG